MSTDRIVASLPRWLAGPLSTATVLAACAGAGCIGASVAFGAYSWAMWGLGAFALSALAWQASDRLRTADRP